MQIINNEAIYEGLMDKYTHHNMSQATREEVRAYFISKRDRGIDPIKAEKGIAKHLEKVKKKYNTDLIRSLYDNLQTSVRKDSDISREALQRYIKDKGLVYTEGEKKGKPISVSMLLNMSLTYFVESQRKDSI